MSQDDELVPDPQVCERYSIVPMTLWRWDHDNTLQFPKPVRIRRRKYRRLSELVAWERAQARASRQHTA
jgi:predicted DNA-binding transcriptional regulator AlpA